MGQAPRFGITSSSAPQLLRPGERGLFLYNLQRSLWLLGVPHFPLTFNTEVKKTEQPMSTKIIKPVTLCSRIPKNLGCSPGAEHSDSTLRLFTWLMDRTVAATNQGSPITEHTPSITATTKRSRWYPHPFCRQQNKKQSIPQHKSQDHVASQTQTLLELESTS